MATIKHSDMRVIENLFIENGYVLDFSDKTFAQFFEDELGIKIYVPEYGLMGTSKGNHLRAFVKTASPLMVSRALRALWSYFEATASPGELAKIESDQERLFELLSRLEAGVPPTPLPPRAWTREEAMLRQAWVVYLDGCTEDELIESVLCPLFRQLNFTRITATGHADKALEYGKDLWMKYRLPTSHDLYFGIQAKRGKIDAAGKSKWTNVSEIHAQSLMMLGHPIFDPETSKRHLVDHAMIVSGGAITKAARNWLGERLSASQRSQILFLDREDLLDLLVTHKLDVPRARVP